MIFEDLNVERKVRISGIEIKKLDKLFKQRCIQFLNTEVGIQF
jgi:hypothetical protein